MALHFTQLVDAGGAAAGAEGFAACGLPHADTNTGAAAGGALWFDEEDEEDGGRGREFGADDAGCAALGACTAALTGDMGGGMELG